MKTRRTAVQAAAGQLLGAGAFRLAPVELTAAERTKKPSRKALKAQ